MQEVFTTFEKKSHAEYRECVSVCQTNLPWLDGWRQDTDYSELIRGMIQGEMQKDSQFDEMLW
jgi:hypothetical protein